MHMPAFSKKGSCLTTAPTSVYKPPPGTVVPNVAKGNKAKKISKKVKIENKYAVTKASKFAQSLGAPKPLTGIVSQKSMGEAKFKKASSKVKAEGKKIVYCGVPATQNKCNMVGMSSGGSMKVKVAV